MNVKIKNNITPENLCLGGFSILFGTFLSYKMYNKIEKIGQDNSEELKSNSDSEKSKFNSDSEESKSNIDSEEDIIQQLKKYKRMGYVILISTIVEYKKKNPLGNFKNFMKNMWSEDYEIILKNDNNDFSCKRDYSHWENIFNKV